MTKRILITGCTGYLGRSLIPLLRQQYTGGQIIGTSRGQAPAELHHMLNRHYAVDLTLPTAVRELIEVVQPEAIIHLAAQREGTLFQLLQANVIATGHLLEAARECAGIDTPVVVVGSAAEIGYCELSDLPLAEDAACRPIDAYGIAKLAQSLLAQAAFLRHDQYVIRVRLFNLIGPRVPSTLLPGRCAQLLANALYEDRPVILDFGDLSTERDYTDIRDVCRALLLALQCGNRGRLYHIGTGRAISGRCIVETLIAEASAYAKHVAYRQKALGGVTVPMQVANASLAADELSWVPNIVFEQSIKDLWRGALTDVEQR